MDAAMRMLARRSLSEEEIRDRLARKGFASEFADETIRRLRELGLADDPGLCMRLAASYRDGRGYGPAKIAWTLRKRGFAPDLVEASVRNCCSAEEEIGAATAVLRRKFRSGPPAGREGAARAYRFLAGRGFSPGACRRAVAILIKDIKEGEDE
jgi:regulatory protein